MAKRFELRPLDGAVIGIVLGAVILALVTGGRGSTSVSADRQTAPTTTSARSATTTTRASSEVDVSGPATSTSTSGPTPTSSPKPTPAPPASSASALIDQLSVAPEGSGAAYDRDLFDHWIDEDGDGCHTRCEVLEAERRTDLPGLPGGGWLSIYDGYSTDDSSELDVDHVVALGEAWRSGADTWDAARRRAFANDLDEPDALIEVTASTNRSKSDRDPASWQPPNRDAWCQFGLGWARVKIKWNLTADEAEVRALRNIVAGC